MKSHSEPVALSEIAADAGLSLSDVAFIADLDESTISRLWADPRWLDRVTGSSLQRMLASVPGVAEYVTGYSIASRLSRLAADLADAGITVNMTALEACRAEGVQVPYVGNALQAALHTIRGDSAKSISYLARFWGRDQDRALGLLVSPGPDGLLAEPERLTRALAELAPMLHRPGYSFHAILAEAAIVHHAKASPAVSSLSRVGDRHDAMSLRSSVMGILINSDDFDVALKYERLAGRTPVLRIIEEWAFPTYTRDARPEPGFNLARSLLLRNTAAEVIREISTYSDAYVHYLLSVYVPLALGRDPTFGLALPGLKAAIRNRLERDGNPQLRARCERTLRELQGVSSD